MKNRILFSLAAALSMTLSSGVAEARELWTKAKAKTWYDAQPWLVGANYTPATAINELEMWQADTFDAATIDKELAFAEKLNMKTMRVFLHNLP